MDAHNICRRRCAQKPFIETDESRKNGVGTDDRRAAGKTLIQQLADLKVINSAPPAEECFRILK